MTTIIRRILIYLTGALIIALSLAIPIIAIQQAADGIPRQDAISIGREVAQNNGLHEETAVRAVTMDYGTLQVLAGHGTQQGEVAKRKVWVVAFKGTVDLGNWPGAPLPFTL